MQGYGFYQVVQTRFDKDKDEYLCVVTLNSNQIDKRLTGINYSYGRDYTDDTSVFGGGRLIIVKGKVDVKDKGQVDPYTNSLPEGQSAQIIFDLKISNFGPGFVDLKEGLLMPKGSDYSVILVAALLQGDTWPNFSKHLGTLFLCGFNLGGGDEVFKNLR